MSVIKLPTTQSRSRSIQRFVGGVTASLAIRLGASKSMGVMGKRESRSYIDFGVRNPYNKMFLEAAFAMLGKCYLSFSNALRLRSKYRRGRALKGHATWMGRPP